ncbi:MAG: hypothetical protein WD052_06650 [Bacteroidales bacterium]
MPSKKSTKIQQIFFLTMLLFIFIGENVAQDHEHDHEHHGTHNELAVGGGIVYSSEAPGLAPAFHVHAIKGLTPVVGIGAGYELILGDEVHQSITALLNLKPTPMLDINVGPGIVLPTPDEPWSLLLNVETALVWPLGERYHIGPVLDFGWSQHGIHVIAGAHVGIHF